MTTSFGRQTRLEDRLVWKTDSFGRQTRSKIIIEEVLIKKKTLLIMILNLKPS